MTARRIFDNAELIQAAGIFFDNEDIRLFYLPQNNKSSLKTVKSGDGLHFKEQAKDISLIDSRNRKVNIKSLEAIRISREQGQYLAVFKINNGLTYKTGIAKSKNLKKFSLLTSIPQIEETAMTVPEYKYQGNYCMFEGGDGLRLLMSKDLLKWQADKKKLITGDRGKSHLEVGTITVNQAGITVFYFEKQQNISSDFSRYLIKAVIFDRENPRKILFAPVTAWEQPEDWNINIVNAKPFGIAIAGERMISYWQINNAEILAIVHEPSHKLAEHLPEIPHIKLRKYKGNPILKPRTENFWESKATFNPAAIYDEGKVHLIYRAIGDQDMSMLGYASSKDGIHIDERLDDPIYVPTADFEFKSNPNTSLIPLSPYASGGGGYGGVEDPRITKIGKKMYMTYVAYDGCSPPRVALTSIDSGDFHNKKWNWKKPVVISKPGVVDKNAVIFPEKINGKYVIMHRIFPNVLIDFVDSLDFEAGTFLKGEFKITPRELSWDSRKLGAGAPPIKTDRGWLLIYHAVDDKDAGRYKIGAMLLDYNDPTHVLSRTYKPILEPDMLYENEGLKSGVVYPCGAVTMKDNLIVYYGGADMVTCAARAFMPKFLNDLEKHHSGHLQTIQLN